MSQSDVESLLQELFSDGDVCDTCQHGWLAVPGVPGLRQWKRWLSLEAQAALTAAIVAAGSLRDGSNQAMYFGNLPAWAEDLLSRLPTDALPASLASRDPLFNQIILNKYLPGEGISDHVDLARFQDGIVSVSLGGPVVMHFTPVVTDGPQQPVQVLLEGGDLLVMSGAARYDWRHGIRHVHEEVFEPTQQRVVRSERISVTLRRMCDDIVLTEPG